MQFWNSGACIYGGICRRSGRNVPGFGAISSARSSGTSPPGSSSIRLARTLPYARQPHHHRRITSKAGPLRPPDAQHRLSHPRERAEDDRAHATTPSTRSARRRRRPSGLPSRRARLNGSAIHEHGCCRMGEDPKRSALNKFNQMHEVKNVFVVDGSAFPRVGEESDADDSGALVAGHGSSRRRD